MFTFFVTYLLLIGSCKAKSTSEIDRSVSLLKQSSSQSEINKYLTQISDDIDLIFPQKSDVQCSECSLHSYCSEGGSQCNCDQGYAGQLCDWSLSKLRTNLTKDFDSLSQFIQNTVLSAANLKLFLTVNTRLVNISGLVGYYIGKDIYGISESIINSQSNLNYQHMLQLNDLARLGSTVMYQYDNFDLNSLQDEYNNILTPSLYNKMMKLYMEQRSIWKMALTLVNGQVVLTQRIKSTRQNDKYIVFDQGDYFTFKIANIRSAQAELGEFYIQIMSPRYTSDSQDYDINEQFTVTFYDTEGNQILTSIGGNLELFRYKVKECYETSSLCLNFQDGVWQEITGGTNYVDQNSNCVCGGYNGGVYGVGYIPNDKRKYDNTELAKNYLLAMILPYFGIQILFIIVYFAIKFPEQNTTQPYDQVKQAEISHENPNIPHSAHQQIGYPQPAFPQQPIYLQQQPINPQQQQIYLQQQPMYPQPVYSQQPMYVQQPVVYLQPQIPQIQQKSWEKRKCDSIWNFFPYQGVCKPSPVRFSAYCLNFANYSFLFGITLYSNGKPAYLQSTDSSTLGYALLYLFLIIFISPWLGYLWSAGGAFVTTIVKPQPYRYIAVLIFQTVLYLVLVLYTGIAILQNKSPKLDQLLNFCIGAGFYVIMLGLELLTTLISYPCECLRKLRAFKFMDSADETS